MKVLNRKLTEQERGRMNVASDNMSVVRVIAMSVDIIVTITVIALLLNFSDSSVIEYLVTGFYSIIALGLLFVISQQQAWCYSVETMTAGQISIAMSYGNTAIGWPFGGFSALYTMTNIIITISLVYAAWVTEWYALVAVISTCFVFTNIAQYYRGRVLLVLLDENAENDKIDRGR